MAKINDTIKIKGRNSDPSSAEEGDLYYNNSDKKLKLYDGSGFINVGNEFSDFIYDDFSGTSVDSSKWSISTVSGATVSYSYNSLYLESFGNSENVTVTTAVDFINYKFLSFTFSVVMEAGDGVGSDFTLKDNNGNEFLRLDMTSVGYTSIDALINFSVDIIKTGTNSFTISYKIFGNEGGGDIGLYANGSFVTEIRTKVFSGSFSFTTTDTLKIIFDCDSGTDNGCECFISNFLYSEQ